MLLPIPTYLGVICSEGKFEIWRNEGLYNSVIIPGSNVYDNVHVLPSCSPYVSNMHDVIYVWPKLLLILQKPGKLFKQATIFFAASVVVIRYFIFFV